MIFNEIANMPSGIALIDPESRRFLQANQLSSTWRNVSASCLKVAAITRRFTMVKIVRQ